MRRTKAITALNSLCRVQEGSRCCSTTRGKTDTKRQVITPPHFKFSTPEAEPDLRVCKPTQCIFCIGDEKLPMAKRLRAFYARGDLKKYFQRKYTRFHPQGKPIDCPHPHCKVTLDNIMHLRNHAERVHQTPT